ncbi:outer dense fiber protein 1 [Melanerpes formicivorus]|uniref:outer dense fiber protein 1 n=1 Tax=Melanerpes formicivorus TaxID=211600 RepID=UPI00358F3F82
MSLHDSLLEEAMQELREAEREMQRQMRLMDLHLQQLSEELAVPRQGSPAAHPCPLCQSDPSPREGRALAARLEGRLDSIQRRLNRMLNSSQDHKLLALVDVNDFEPKKITVSVKGGKVKVLAECEEEHTTPRGKEHSYKKFTKEISLPPGVSEDQVTYSLESNGIVKIKMACECCPCALSH